MNLISIYTMHVIASLIGRMFINSTSNNNFSLEDFTFWLCKVESLRVAENGMLIRFQKLSQSVHKTLPSSMSLSVTWSTCWNFNQTFKWDFVV